MRKFHVIGYWYWPLQTVWSWISNASDHLLLPLCWQKVTSHQTILFLSLEGFPNQMFYAKYFSSVLSPSMTRSPAVMLSPHQWSMPCPILSPTTFCFCSQVSAPHIISCHGNKYFMHLNFWHHGGKGGGSDKMGRGGGHEKGPQQWRRYVKSGWQTNHRPTLYRVQSMEVTSSMKILHPHNFHSSQMVQHSTETIRLIKYFLLFRCFCIWTYA